MDSAFRENPVEQTVAVRSHKLTSVFREEQKFRAIPRRLHILTLLVVARLAAVFSIAEASAATIDSSAAGRSWRGTGATWAC